MPRPIKDDPRDCFKSFRFTGAEVTRLEARARASGQTLSAYVRDRVLETSSVGSHGEGDLDPVRHPAGSPKDGVRSTGNGWGRTQQIAARLLADQLRRVGTNLNQIAHRMNELRIPPPRELVMLLDEIRTYVRQAREL